MDKYIDTINKQYSDHYKYVGRLKSGYKKRNARKLYVAVISGVLSVVVIIVVNWLR